MRMFLAVAHPEPASLTQAIARRFAEGAAAAGHSVEIADLAGEGFDPRFTRIDLAVARGQGLPSEDVLAYQRRIDASEAVVLVFPIYWWSMPALLKGWIDRVFARGWAYGIGDDGRVVKTLRHLDVHILAVGGADQGVYDRHGYLSAMRTQIDHGIFDYCGARVVTSDLMLDSDSVDPTPHLERAHALGRSIVGRESHPARGAA